MDKKCGQCGLNFAYNEHDKEMLARFAVPESELCFSCRQQRIYNYRNERSLYQRKCDKCKKGMISMFAQDCGYTVYCYDCWWNDFDATKYGRDFDFGKPFFEQYDRLLHEVPLPHMVIGNAENSDYTNYSWQNKDCYLITSSDYCEDCYFSAYLLKAKSCLDCIFVNESELLYQCVDCDKCYGSVGLQNCSNCSSSLYCLDCKGCRDCIGCVGLRQKQYCIYNEQFSREEYEAKRAGLLPTLVVEFEKFKKKFPVRYADFQSCENCSGDHLKSCKNAKCCFDMVGAEDCSYCALGLNPKDCMDCVGATGGTELSYMSAACPENYALKFSACVWPKSTYLDYCLFSRASNYCFGSVSLLKNQYCILNKQYSKQEYEELVSRIIGQSSEWGQFFPPGISPFAYNETIAQDYYPLEKSEVLARGWKWRDEDEKVVRSGEDIRTCEITGRSFKLIPQEKKFYERMGLALPNRCPDQRHQDRLRMRTRRGMVERKCSRCGTGVATAYLEADVLCEKCYEGGIY